MLSIVSASDRNLVLHPFQEGGKICVKFLKCFVEADLWEWKDKFMGGLEYGSTPSGEIVRRCGWDRPLIGGDNMSWRG